MTSSLSSTKKSDDQCLKTGERRITRSTNNVSLSFCEKEIDNTLIKRYKTSNILVLEDRVNSLSNTFKLHNNGKDEVVPMLNINLGDSVPAPLNCRRKIAEETCDINVKKQRKRGNRKLFWENKLTGACRISKRLKNMKVKNQELAKKQTYMGLYTYRKRNNDRKEKRSKQKQTKKMYPKMSSRRRSSHGSTIKIKSIKLLSLPGSNKYDAISNNSTDLESENIFTEVKIDSPAMTVDENNKLTLVEDVECTEVDSNVVPQYPEDSDSKVLQATINDKESSHVHENIQAIEVNSETGEDLLCEACVDSVLKIDEGREVMTLNNIPLEEEAIIANCPENTCEVTEKSIESFTESAKVQGNLLSPNDDS